MPENTVGQRYGDVAMRGRAADDSMSKTCSDLRDWLPLPRMYGNVQNSISQIGLAS